MNTFIVISAIIALLMLNEIGNKLERIAVLLDIIKVKQK